MEKRQFNLAKMFHLTSVTAIVVAFVAPVIRSVLAGEGFQLTLGALHAVFLAILVARRALGRDRTKLVGGKLLYRTPRYSSNQIENIKTYDWIFLGSVLVYIAVVSAVPAKSIGELIALLMHPMFLLWQYFILDQAARTLVAGAYGIDQHMFEVYEKGYCLNTFKFKRLEDLVDVKLHRQKNKIELVFGDTPMQPSSHRVIAVPEAYRDHIANKLTSCLAPRVTRPYATLA